MTALSFDRALVLFAQGSPSACLELLPSSPEATILRMRALIQLNRQAAIVEDRKEILTIQEPYREESRMLLGAALCRSGDQAGEAFLREGMRSEHLAIAEESAYHLAFSCWRLDRMEEASSILQNISSAAMRPKVIELQAWIEARGGNYQRQIDLLKEAYPLSTPWNRAFILRSLAALVKEMSDANLASFVRYEAEHMAWTPDMRECEFWVSRDLGYCAALDGNEVQALRYFRKSRQLATTPVLDIIAVLDRQAIARVESDIIANDLVEYAMEQAEKVAWQNVSDDQRSALLQLAIARTHTNPTDSLKYLEKYDSCLHSTANLARRIDIRAKAYEDDARGVVLKALGRQSEASTHLKAAFATWTKINYRWRAVMTVSNLLDLTHAGMLRSGYVEYLQIVALKEFPRAWFTKSFGARLRFCTDPRITALSPSQQQLLEALVLGLPHKEIANNLTISQKTVQNRSSELYRVFGVGSQAELVAYFAKHNLLP